MCTSHATCIVVLPQLEYAQEEQQFLQDECADTQARLAELAQEEEDAPNARAMQRVTRSIQETERQVRAPASGLSIPSRHTHLCCNRLRGCATVGSKSLQCVRLLCAHARSGHPHTLREG